MKKLSWFLPVTFIFISPWYQLLVYKNLTMAWPELIGEGGKNWSIGLTICSLVILWFVSMINTGAF